MSSVRPLRCFIVLMVVSALAIADQKRLLLHSQDDLFSFISNLQTELEALKTNVSALEASKRSSNSEVEALKTKVNDLEVAKQSSEAKVQALTTKVSVLEAELQTNRGSDVCIRWGRTTCPTNGSELVYHGYAAGSHYAEVGGGSNAVCLPAIPSWSHYVDGENDGAFIYGTEMEIQADQSSALFGNAHPHNQDIPCAVCKIPATSVMIPARSNCYPGWNLEYSGYLISAHPNWPGKTDYACLDADFEYLAHGGGNDNGHLFRPVEVKCGHDGGLPCPPYVDGRELACVVCSM